MYLAVHLTLDMAAPNSEFHLSNMEIAFNVNMRGRDPGQLHLA